MKFPPPYSFFTLHSLLLTLPPAPLETCLHYLVDLHINYEGCDTQQLYYVTVTVTYVFLMDLCM